MWPKCGLQTSYGMFTLKMLSVFYLIASVLEPKPVILFWSYCWTMGESIYNILCNVLSGLSLL